MLSAEQLEMRKTRLGASEIPAVAGLAPWSSPMSVFLSRMGLVADLDESFTDVGDELEEPIARLVTKRHGLTLNPYPGSLRHPTREHILATPDRIVVEEEGERTHLQIKNVGYRVMRHWADDSLPTYVRAQVEVESAVLGVSHCYVAALLGGRDLQFHKVENDEGLASLLMDMGEDFYRKHIATGIPPEPDESEAYRTYLEQKYPRHMAPLKAAPPEASMLVEMYSIARRQREDAEKREATAKNKLRAMIGEAEGIVGDWGRITWRHAKSGGINYKGIVEELNPPPEMMLKYRAPGSRRFVYTPKEEGK